ncbi:MAG: nuclear transport factor 2 family protein [Bacteroidetes bacterium]|nr:nuclear transport factor 2 family protein [Bacteroidota bacterium]
MKNKIVNAVLLSYVISMIIACNPGKENPSVITVDKEKIKIEIQAKEDEFAATYNSGVAKNIGYYAEDAISFAQHRPPLVGKKAIVTYLIDGLDPSSKSNKISYKTSEVFVSNDGNLVIEVGYYKVLDSNNTAVNTGNYMCLFEKRDGKYVCVRDMSASDMPIK